MYEIKDESDHFPYKNFVNRKYFHVKKSGSGIRSLKYKIAQTVNNFLSERSDPDLDPTSPKSSGSDRIWIPSTQGWKKPGFFWVFLGFFWFFGFFWVFLGFFAQTRGFLGFISVSRILYSASRL
jgi:hypothetical protein